MPFLTAVDGGAARTVHSGVSVVGAAGAQRTSGPSFPVRDRTGVSDLPGRSIRLSSVPVVARSRVLRPTELSLGGD